VPRRSRLLRPPAPRSPGPRALSALAGALLLALLALPAACGAQTISSRSWSTVAPGVRLLGGRTTSPTTRFWALEIALCTDYVHMAASSAGTARRTASSWGSAAGVVAAVNGDFFRTDTSTPVTYGQAVGGGRVWPAAQSGEGGAYTGDWYYRRYGWIAFGPGWVEFSHTEAVRRAGGTSEGFLPGRATTGEVPSGTVALVSGFPELVTEGRRVTCASPTATGCFADRSDMRSRNPRTAMGLSADRRTFWLVVVDGRSSVSAGMYGTELAWLMSELGAWQAFNLDGGGSSTLWTAGGGIENAPSDGSARVVANHWGVFAGSGSGRTRAPGSCVPAPAPDAGVAPGDAGPSPSDGGIAAADAGPEADAGAGDAGSRPEDDAGTRDGDGPSDDAGASRDAGLVSDGCACRLAPPRRGRAPGPSAALGAVLAFVLARRRARGRRRSAGLPATPRPAGPPDPEERERGDERERGVR